MAAGCSSARYKHSLMLAAFCVSFWFFGSFLGHLVKSHFPAAAGDTQPKRAAEPQPAGTVPRSPKCGLELSCPEGSFTFRIMSGGGLKKAPYICFEGNVIIGAAKFNYGRGMNIAVVNASSGTVTGFRTFDMWAGDNSDAMEMFLQKTPPRSLVLMATYDEGSTKLKPMAKAEIKKLGSKLIEKISFRASWVFLGTKGVAIPENLTRELMVHRTPKTNVYKGWPHETEIEGCLERYRS